MLWPWIEPDALPDDLKEKYLQQCHEQAHLFYALGGRITPEMFAAMPETLKAIYAEHYRRDRDDQGIGLATAIAAGVADPANIGALLEPVDGGKTQRQIVRRQVAEMMKAGKL